MKVIIFGAGDVGIGVAQALINVSIDVVIIEKDQLVAQDTANKYGIHVIHGDCMDLELYSNPIFNNATHVIGLTNEDSVNILACKLSYLLNKVPYKLARLDNKSLLNPTYADIFSNERLAVDFHINTNEIICNKVIDLLCINNAIDVCCFDDVIVFCARCLQNSQFRNIQLNKLKNIAPNVDYAIFSIIRDNEFIKLDPHETIMPDDFVYFIAQPKYINDIFMLLGYKQNNNINLCMLGCENLGEQIVKTITDEIKNEQYNGYTLNKNDTQQNKINKFTQHNIDIKIFENSKEKAEEIAIKYPDISVLNMDFLSNNELYNECNTFIAISNNTEVNVLATLIANKIGIPKSILISKDKKYNFIVDSHEYIKINPVKLTISKILDIIRSIGIVNKAHYLNKELGAIVEFEFNDDIVNLEDMNILYVIKSQKNLLNNSTNSSSANSQNYNNNVQNTHALKYDESNCIITKSYKNNNIFNGTINIAVQNEHPVNGVFNDLSEANKNELKKIENFKVDSYNTKYIFDKPQYFISKTVMNAYDNNVTIQNGDIVIALVDVKKFYDLQKIIVKKH